MTHNTVTHNCVGWMHHIFTDWKHTLARPCLFYWPQPAKISIEFCNRCNSNANGTKTSNSTKTNTQMHRLRMVSTSNRTWFGLPWESHSSKANMEDRGLNGISQLETFQVSKLTKVLGTARTGVSRSRWGVGIDQFLISLSSEDEMFWRWKVVMLNGNGNCGTIYLKWQS